MNPSAQSHSNCFTDNSDIILTNSCILRITANSHDIWRADKCHQLEYIGEHNDCDDTARPSNIYDYFGGRYGVSFFIGERKTHYNELKQYVFWPLASLEPAQTDTKIFQNFFDRFRFIMAYNPESYVIQYGKALMHMQKEAPDSLKQIGSFYKNVESLNKDVDALETLVKDTYIAHL